MSTTHGTSALTTGGVTRFTGSFACPICRGSDDDPRGDGSRCWGFLSGDGKYAHCTRPEHAGGLTAGARTNAYAHKLHGPCRCGQTHGAAIEEPRRNTGAKSKAKAKKYDRPYSERLVTSHIYKGPDGDFRLKVDRLKDPKKFAQFHPEGTRGDGSVNWTKGGAALADQVPYNLPAIVAASPNTTIFYVEGEKDADRLNGLGLVATCNAMGAGKADVVKAIAPRFAGRHVAIVPDNDDPGRDHAEMVAAILNPIAASVRVVDGLVGLPDKGDVSDWLNAGGTIKDLLFIAQNCPEWEPRPTIRMAEGVDDEDNPKLPMIFLGVDQAEVIDAAEASLADDPTLFSRANSIVRVLSSVSGRKKWHPDRPAGTPHISNVELPTLSEKMSRVARYRKAVTLKDGREVEKSVIPPQWAVAGLLARGMWPSFRHLEGITEAPTIRTDGSILDTPGWDEETGLLYIPNGAFDPIPDQPTRDDARAAADVLYDLVSDFPFKDESHRAAWLAALLTVVGRSAIDGPIPIFLFDANNRGSGKTKLCDVINAVATGREIARKSNPEDDAEMRKVITSIAMAGDRATLFDNIPSGGVVGSAVLDAASTSTIWKDRPLATNKIPEFPWKTVLFFTGNNLSTRADSARRFIFCRMETTEIRPEERDDFKIKECLVAYTKNNRSKLLAAALTILRAHAVAGRPMPQGLVKIDYNQWSSVIRGAIAWATEVDPCATRAEARATDQESVTLDGLTVGWKALCDSENASALTAAQAISALEKIASGEHAGLRDVLCEWSRDGKLPSPRVIGNRMGKFIGRPTEHGSLAYHTISGNRSWYVKPPTPKPYGGSGGSSGSAPSAFAGESLGSKGSQSKARDLPGSDGVQEPLEQPEPPTPAREVEL